MSSLITVPRLPVIAEHAPAVNVRGQLLAPQPGLGLLVALPQLARAEHEKRIALKRRLLLEIMLEHVTCHNMFSGDFYVHRELKNDPEFIQFNKRFAMNGTKTNFNWRKSHVTICF